jgi:hypothetical protein
MNISWLAMKVVSGTLRRWRGLMVVPCAWLLLRPGVDLTSHAGTLFALMALLWRSFPTGLALWAAASARITLV